MKWLTRKEEERLWEEKDKSKITCKCGHVNIIMNKNGYHLCSWCKNYVFKDKQTELINLKKLDEEEANNE